MDEGEREEVGGVGPSFSRRSLLEFISWSRSHRSTGILRVGQWTIRVVFDLFDLISFGRLASFGVPHFAWSVGSIDVRRVRWELFELVNLITFVWFVSFEAPYSSWFCSMADIQRLASEH